MRGAGFVVFTRGTDDVVRLLMLQNATHRSWGVPKGHLEPGEDEPTGAWREVAEETGLGPAELTLIDGFERRIEYTVRRRGLPLLKRVTLYLAQLPHELRDRVRLSPEHSALSWASAEAVAKMIEWSDLRDVLDAAARHATANG